MQLSFSSTQRLLPLSGVPEVGTALQGLSPGQSRGAQSRPSPALGAAQDMFGFWAGRAHGWAMSSLPPTSSPRPLRAAPAPALPSLGLCLGLPQARGRTWSLAWPSSPGFTQAHSHLNQTHCIQPGWYCSCEKKLAFETPGVSLMMNKSTCIFLFYTHHLHKCSWKKVK